MQFKLLTYYFVLKQVCQYKFSISYGMGIKKQSKIRRKRKRKKNEKTSKRIIKSFFLNGNLNQNDKMSAKDMYNELLVFVESGELKAENIPKIITIQNWISSYARTFKEQATENMVNNNTLDL